MKASSAPTWTPAGSSSNKPASAAGHPPPPSRTKIETGRSHPSPSIGAPADSTDLTRCLNAMRQGQCRSDELLPLVYNDLRCRAAAGMARERANQTLQPTALVHEAWMRVAGPSTRVWENRAHFFGAAARAMRRILIENARRKARIKHGGAQERMSLDQVEVASKTPEENVLLIDEALEQLKLHDADKARIVELKFFGGCSTREVAEVLGVSERSVERQWAYAKAWLFKAIQSQVHGQ